MSSTPGASLVCSCCGHACEAFLPFGLRPRRDARCPACGALERHRLLALFLEARTDLLTRGSRLLHMAPEPPLASRVKRADLHYVGADLGPGLVSARMDITRLPFQDATFDAIICNHVLEHIPDDRAAMSELLRMLAPGGWAILQSPLDSRRAETLEDPSVTDPCERERLFGQRDHVRQYGRDYGDRLRHAGFHLDIVPFEAIADEQRRRRHALLPEDVYLCWAGTAAA